MTTRTKFLLLAATLVLALPAAGQKPDAAGCKDDPMFPVRMPKYRIERCEKKEFGAYDFYTAKPPRKRVEGEFTFITYTVDAREDDRSGLEVIRNYENALRRIGGTVHASDPERWVTGFVKTGGGEVWVQAEKGNGKIWLRIVRPQAMAQTIVADAASLAGDLKASGHVAVDGIYFDTASAALKPESAAALEQIAKLLAADPAVKVFVVGHTDGMGSPESNLDLSRKRAEAVVAALTRDHGVAAGRLRPFGNGPFAPVASNATEEGRARNRRVELVRQ